MKTTNLFLKHKDKLWVLFVASALFFLVNDSVSVDTEEDVTGCYIVQVIDTEYNRLVYSSRTYPALYHGVNTASLLKSFFPLSRVEILPVVCER